MVRDEKRDALVLELFDQGYKREEIKKMCHLGSMQTVTEILKKYGKSYKERDKERSDERRRKAIEMYSAGYTLTDIARELGICVAYVHSFIETSDVVIPGELKPFKNIPYDLRVEWTRVVNMFRTQVMGKEPFRMPVQ